MASSSGETMKRIAIVSGLAAALCAAPVFAVDLDPNARAKAITASAASAAPAPAPTRVQLPEIGGGLDADGRGFTGACAATRADVCYDYREGRIVYKSSRQWMPEVSGLTAESISVRRDRVQFHYSFR